MEVLARFLSERHFIIIKLISKIVIAFIFTVGLIGMSFLFYLKTLDKLPIAVPHATIYYAEDGTVIGESNSNEKRYWVELENISQHLIDATVTIEDKRFYNHIGIDFKRIAGAIVADLKARGKVQGASTITQQYARNLFLEHEKSWRRKLTEIIYALRLELNYSKEEILEGYLNTINYGHGAYGIEAASQFYFNKNARDLSLSEATMLAGIPKGPAKFSPLVASDKAKQRQQLIVTTMAQNKIVNDDELNDVLEEELIFHGKHQFKRNEIAPYFQDAVINFLKNDLSLQDHVISQGGLRVYTTLNTDDQEIAEQTVKKIIPSDSKIQASLVTIDNKKGYVTALVGGTNYDESPFNRATQSVRQPGSTLKPLLYYAALENGFTPATLIRSERTTFHLDGYKEAYRPTNFNNEYADKEITLAQALALSDNIYAVKTHLFLGEETLPKTAQRFGITTEMAEVASLALGSSEVRLIEMAQAYSMFANGGQFKKPTFIKKIENYRGDVIYEHESEGEQTLDPRLTFLMTHMLTGVFDRSLNGYTAVTGDTIIDKMTRQYAGKSGSTNTDNWMIGYSPQKTTAVWTGYDKGRRIELTAEKSYAKNIWVDFMELAHKDLPVEQFQEVSGTVAIYIDNETGLRARDTCPVKRLTYFLEGTEPLEYCTAHEEPNKYDNYFKEKLKKIPWYRRLFGF